MAQKNGKKFDKLIDLEYKADQKIKKDINKALLGDKLRLGINFCLR